MKSMVVITKDKLEEYLSYNQTCFLLPLENYAVSYEKTYTKEEIKDLRKKYPSLEFFVVINKTIFNEDLKELEQILEYLDGLSIQGIFFYDLAILELKQRKSLKTPLVWNQTHLVTNSKTCNFYLENGVDYALIAGELEKSEILSLIENTQIKLCYTLLSKPIIAHSRRNLITNYEKMTNNTQKEQLIIHESLKNQDYLVTEQKEGTSFFYQDLPNYYSILKDIEVEYVILNESYIDHTIFMKLLNLTNQYLDHKISFPILLKSVEPYLSKDTLFLSSKTIYRVKKEEK